jgi:hypothetical protein
MLLKALFKPLGMATPDLTAHIEGVPAGNDSGNYEDQVGHLPDGRSTAARSTGIGVAAREPILPQMPNVSPP